MAIEYYEYTYNTTIGSGYDAISFNLPCNYIDYDSDSKNVKLYAQDGNIYTLGKNEPDERIRINATDTGFEQYDTGDYRFDIPMTQYVDESSSFQAYPMAAYKECSIGDIDVLYVGEILYTAPIEQIRQLYYVNNGEVASYIKFKPNGVTLPNRYFRVAKDGTAYQMIVNKESTEIVKYTPLRNELIKSDEQLSLEGESLEKNESRTNSQQTTQTGIPYSYGGSFGIDLKYESSVSYNFVQGVSQGKYTANAGGAIVTFNAIGLDCSGFVELCKFKWIHYEKA